MTDAWRLTFLTASRGGRAASTATTCTWFAGSRTPNGCATTPPERIKILPAGPEADELLAEAEAVAADFLRHNQTTKGKTRT